MDCRKAPISERESVSAPGPPLPTTEKPINDCALATGTIETQTEQNAVDDGPQAVAIEPRVMRRREKDNGEMEKALWSFSLDCKEPAEDVNPRYTEVDLPLAPDLVRSTSKRLKASERQIDKWNIRGETSDRKAYTKQKQLSDVENTRQNMHVDLIECGKQIQNLKGCLKNSCQKHDVQTQVLSDKIESLSRERENLINECRGWRGDFAQLQWQHKTLKSDYRELQRKHDDHMDVLQRTISENTVLRNRINDQELSVTMAQNAAMSVLSNSLSAELPDDRIRARFSELFERIAEWARENAAAPDGTIFSHPETMYRLQEDGLIRQIGGLGLTPDFNFDLEDDTAVDTLLNATLTRRFCQDFLEDPFWFVNQSSSIFDLSFLWDERFGTNFVLKQMLNRMTEDCGGNEAMVHAWRASTVQILANSEEARKKISALYRHYLEDKILPRYEALIRIPLSPIDANELVAIVESFGNFAIKLSSQKMEVSCYHLESFADKVYWHTEPHMEIARAVGIEQGDVKLDGRPIPVVVQPLIMGRGTHDGKDYGKSRVWSKAVVWVSKDEKPAVMPDSDATQGSGFSRLWRNMLK